MVQRIQTLPRELDVTSISNTRGKSEIVTAFHEGGSFDILRHKGYINLTQMAVAFPGKRIDNWMRLKSTKEYIQIVQEVECDQWMMKAVLPIEGRNLTPSDLRELKSRYGVSDPGTGTWAHRLVAIEFARWLSPRFGVWCNKQILHLLEYGEVNLHYQEWADADLIMSSREDRDDNWHLSPGRH